MGEKRAKCGIQTDGYTRAGPCLLNVIPMAAPWTTAVPKDGWSMLTARRGSSHSLQAPRSRRLLPRPALLGQGTGTTLLGPTGTPSFPIDLSSSPHLGAKPGVLGASRLERIHRTHMGPSWPGSLCWRGRWHTFGTPGSSRVR